MALNTGIAFGRSVGIEAISLNVHYTDGVYEDPTTETFKIATDGIKIYYTPDMRKYTSMRKELINIPFGANGLVIPPSIERFFVTRTCIVDTSCQDATNNQLELFFAQYLGFSGRRRHLDEDESISCEMIKSYCFEDEDSIYIQRLCPVSCGLCGDMPDDTDGTNTKVNPRDPLNYRVSSINHHAHLLGTEMYATLLREEEEEEDTQDQEDVAKKQADISSTPWMTVKDLKSREIWFYDNQETIPMDKEFVIDVDNEDGGSNTAMVGGVEVKAGDKIQVSCVYNSMNRNEPTYFGLSTYEEMCMIGVFVTFKTPLLDEIGDVDFGTELNLRSFNCALDDENHTTDVWQGTLESDEDGRNIWYDHPIETTDMCTYPVEGMLYDYEITGEARDCPEKEDDNENKNNFICFGDDELLSSPIAGYTCEGGTYDQKDSNEVPLYMTKDKCIIEGGGTDYISYTCSDAEFFLATQASVLGVADEIKELLKTWWQPKCCSPKTADSSSSGAYVGFFRNGVSYAVVASTLTMVMAIIASII
jgi:hypothetical protein